MTDPRAADGYNAPKTERIVADIEAIAGFSESPPEVGYSRPTFSPPWREARDYIIAQAAAAGAEHVVDAAGNVHIRHRDVGWNRRVWLSGSHIDSVPSGGKYDGVMGIVVPLEILRSNPALPLEIVIFAEEEGTTFGLGMLGSRAWTGAIGVETLSTIKNRHASTYLEAGADHGVEEPLLRSAPPADTPPDAPGQRATEMGWRQRLDASRYVGFVEVHAEQGLHLWDTGRPIAAVNRINGRRQFDLTLAGQANHAGSTGMAGRRDALAGAAQLITALEELGRRLAQELSFTVLTVGSVTVSPNAVNVIAGTVRLTIDFRAREEAMLERGEAEIRRLAAAIAGERRLTVSLTRSEKIAPAPLDEGICDALRRSADEAGAEMPIASSGALHDAAVLAPHLPTAMVFVASRDGISHNPAEFSRSEDIALAARVLARTIAAHPHGIASPTARENGDG